MLASAAYEFEFPARVCRERRGNSTAPGFAGSEPRNVGKRQLPGAHMHPAELGTAVQHGEDLSRIEQAVRVERAFQALLLIEVDLAEHGRHEIALLHADPVLAGQHATDLDAKSEDFGAERLGPFELAVPIGVVQN